MVIGVNSAYRKLVDRTGLIFFARVENVTSITLISRLWTKAVEFA
jgi:hypothetical protein